jgi:hypothetical protein
MAIELLSDISGQVTVHKHPETGLLITRSKAGKAFGYMVKCSKEVWETKANGMTVQDIKTRAAFVVVPDKQVDVRENGIAKKMLLSDFYVESGRIADGKTLPGTIAVKEQLIPFPKSDGSPGDPQYNIKVNPETKDVCTYEGYPIFRKQIYFANGNEPDEMAKEWKERTGFVTKVHEVKLPKADIEELELALADQEA